MSKSYSFNIDGATLSSLTDDDVILVVNDPAGTPSARVVTRADLLADMLAGIHEDRWDDLRFPAAGLDLPGAVSDPDRDTTYGWLLFDAASTETVTIIAQLPHHWKEASTLKPHVHWHKTTSASGDVRWRLDYYWSAVGEVLTSVTTLTATTPSVSDGDTAQQHAITPMGDISATGREISDILILVFSRTGTHADDTYGADAAMLEFDIHYQIDSHGSVAEYDKDGV